MNAYALASVIVVCLCCVYVLHMIVGMSKKELFELEKARKALIEYDVFVHRLHTNEKVMSSFRERLETLEKLAGRVDRLEMVRRL